MNESLLTGEADEITKRKGDKLMSGSFIVSGQCHARLDKVGEDSYISKLTLQAKAMQSKEQSEMIRSLDKLVKCVGVAIIPIGIVLFLLRQRGHRLRQRKRDIYDRGGDRNDSGRIVSSCKCGACGEFNSSCTEKSAFA